MQKKKDEVRDLILEVAKKEFLEKGFAKASLREMARKAGISKGNIYIYFKNKDALFSELVNPVWSIIERSMTTEPEEIYLKSYGRNETKSFEEVIGKFKENVPFFYKNFDALKLLFTASAGSSMEDFRERISQLYAQSSQTFISALSQPESNYSWDVTEMFIHTLASLYLRFLEEVIVHEPNPEELDKYIREIAVFVTYGTLALRNEKIEE